MEGKRKRDARLHEQQLRFQQSGQAAVAFCRDEGVVLSTFYPRGRRYRTDAQFHLPVYLNYDVQTYLAASAESRGIEPSGLVNKLPQREIALI